MQFGAAAVGRDLDLPSGVVVTVAAAHQDPARLQIAIGRVVVGAGQVDGVVLDGGAVHDTFEVGQDEAVVDVPLVLSLHDLTHV